MWEFDSEVSDIIQRTATIRSFRFPIRAKGISYQVGQFFFVTIKVEQGEGIHHLSFSSSPTERGYVEFTKRITKSAYSQALSQMDPGSWARLQGPAGDFTLPLKPQKIAFLTAGIGITPQRSMIRYIADKRLTFDVVLLYGNHSWEDICFREELGELAKELPNFRLKHILTVPPVGWEGPIGHVDTELVERLIPDYKERLLYISGPQRMVMTLADGLLALGVSPPQVKRDLFTGYD